MEPNTEDWVTELTLYLQNKIFVGAESVVEAFRSKKLLTEEEIREWDKGAAEETFLTVVLMKRMIEHFALRKSMDLDVDVLIQPKIKEPSAVDADGVYLVSHEETSQLVKEMEQSLKIREDCCYIIGVSNDMDSVIPVLNHITKGDIENIFELGIFPSRLTDTAVSTTGVEEKKTLFTNAEHDGSLRWDHVDFALEPWLYRIKSGDAETSETTGLLSYALKVSAKQEPRQAINWNTFPILLIR